MRAEGVKFDPLSFFGYVTVGCFSPQLEEPRPRSQHTTVVSNHTCAAASAPEATDATDAAAYLDLHLVLLEALRVEEHHERAMHLEGELDLLLRLDATAAAHNDETH